MRRYEGFIPIRLDNVSGEDYVEILLSPDGSEYLSLPHNALHLVLKQLLEPTILFLDVFRARQFA